MKTLTILIDGKKYQAEEGEPVLKVARREGIDIPNLCYHEALTPYGSCRLCIVEVIAGAPKGLTTSCTLAARDGIEVKTDTQEIREIRKALLELYLAEAPGSEYIRELAAKYGVTESRFARKLEPEELENKCVLCGLCVRVCNEIIGVGAINYIGRGPNTKVNTPYLEPSSKCIGCGACAYVCPTDAIKIADIAGGRVMETWSETAVPLKRCKVCGKYFAPEPLSEVVYDRFPDLADDLRGLCPDCRRKLNSRKVFLAATGRMIEGER